MGRRRGWSGGGHVKRLEVDVETEGKWSFIPNGPVVLQLLHQPSFPPFCLLFMIFEGQLCDVFIGAP